MVPSTKEEIEKADALVSETNAKIRVLLQNGKKVHIIWDFDGVLADSRSDDAFKALNFDLKKYFEYEERLLFQSPGPGRWLLPIAHNCGIGQQFPSDKFTQDIVTARSSNLAIRVHIFCLTWRLPLRWMLFIGHQSKKESYRIILDSFKNDPDVFIFCIDDAPKHIENFSAISTELNMESRTNGILSPVIRTYSEAGLKKHIKSVLSAKGKKPLRVRDPSDDTRGFIVAPKGVAQFREQIDSIVDQQSNLGHQLELRNAFEKANGKVGKGRFKTEEDLELAMHQFIIDLWT